jgi:hydroxymethylglutaryl-CoA lyase
MKLTESARDAFMSLKQPVAIEQKAKYLNKLLLVGFELLDVGSFEPDQDTAALLARLDLTTTSTQLLVAVPDTAGATQAAAFDQVGWLSYALTNVQVSPENAQTLTDLQAICRTNHKKLIVYVNTDFEDSENVANLVETLAKMEIGNIVLEDTTGGSTTENIKAVFEPLIAQFPQVAFGAHLHAKPSQIAKKVKAAYKAGVQGLDCTVRGLGGCALANDKKIGNLATELVMSELQQLGVSTNLDDLKLAEAMLASQYVFE